MSGDVRSRNSLSGLNSLGQTVPLCKKIYLELEQLRKIVYNMTLGLFFEIVFVALQTTKSRETRLVWLHSYNIFLKRNQLLNVWKIKHAIKRWLWTTTWRDSSNFTLFQLAVAMEQQKIAFFPTQIALLKIILIDRRNIPLSNPTLMQVFKVFIRPSLHEQDFDNVTMIKDRYLSECSQTWYCDSLSTTTTIFGVLI